MIATRRLFTAPWLIGIVLGCLALIALGLALSGAAQRPEVVMAFQIYLANEWRTEKPVPAWTSELAQYRAGERTAVSVQRILAGWAQ